MRNVRALAPFIPSSNPTALKPKARLALAGDQARGGEHGGERARVDHPLVGLYVDQVQRQLRHRLVARLRRAPADGVPALRFLQSTSLCNVTTLKLVLATSGVSVDK